MRLIELICENAYAVLIYKVQLLYFDCACAATQLRACSC